MNFGLIGLGKWGKNYITTINQLGSATCNTTRVCSKSVDSYNRLASRPSGIHYWEGDWRSVCASPDVDAVIIAAGPELNYEIAVEAIENKKHVICEKPFVFQVKEGLHLQSLARKHGVSFLINYVHLWNPDYVELKKRFLYDLSYIFVNSRGMDFGPFREKYSALWDWGSHDVALVLDFFNNEPELVKAIGDKRRNNEFSNSITAVLHFDTTDTQTAILNFGNFGHKRERVFSVRTESLLLEFEDQKKHQPLKEMVKSFVEASRTGTINNLDLGIKVTKVLKRIEDCLKNENSLHRP